MTKGRGTLFGKLALLGIVLFLFFSCKSSHLEPKEEVQEEEAPGEESLPEETPKEEKPVIEVDPLSLLEDDFSVYLSLPARENKSLCVKIIKSCVEGVSESDAESIAERIDVLYAGSGRVDDRSSIEAAFNTTIPRFFLRKALTEKNGWVKSNYEDDTVKIEKYRSDNAGFELSLIQSGTMCIAQDLNGVFNIYSSLISQLNQNTEQKKWTSWVRQSGSDIYFYITRPGQYLRSLIGQSINLGTEAVYGKFARLESSKPENLYDLSFNIKLTQKRSVQVLYSLLELSFSMAGGSVTQTDDLTLMLTGVEISEDQIVNMFFQDKIRAHHYKVVKDSENGSASKIIEE